MAEAARKVRSEETARSDPAPAVRAAEPARATLHRAFDSSRSVLLSPRAIQPALEVSQPSDAAEQEADRVAQAVVSMPDPGPQATQRSAPMVHRAAAAPKAAKTDPAVEAEVRKAATGGTALPAKTRGLLEPRFRASFANVRIHTDGNAAKLAAKLAARAFTFGNHIFFSGGAYNPDSKSGLELLAHELTHTIQQGETIQRKAEPGAAAQVTQRTPRQAARLGMSDALHFFADAANAIPGYRMFTILLGVNPIDMSAVEASPANILRAIVEFLPGGFVISRVLDAYGVFDRVGNWISAQLKSLGITGASIKAAIDAFLKSLKWSDIFDLPGVWARAKAIFTEPITKIIAFARSLYTEVKRIVWEAVLRPLAALAEGTAGYPLLKAVLGVDPVTGEAVPRNADTVIGGFMTLIGQDELYQNIKKARAGPRAWAWFQGALGGLMGIVRSIPTRFMALLHSLEVMDFVVLPQAFGKVASAFGGFMADFGKWALGTTLDLAKIIIEVVAPGVMPYIAKAGAAFNTIVKNPIRFVQTLVSAGKLGFSQFRANFLGHLQAALVGWLTGAMAGAAVYIPQGFSPREILKFALSVLGLTWANIRGKLVRAIGEPAVKALEMGFDLVKTLVTEGPAAAWQKILEALTNLKDMVIQGVLDFVKSKVVEIAVTKLLSMLSPAGALIQAIIAIYNTIMFFKERLSQIAQVAAAFIDGIAAIAAGNIGPAANRVEQVMARSLTVVISFLARIAGLGKVADAVTNIINKVRAPIDKGMDKAVDWIVAQAKKLGKLLIDKVTGKANRTPEDLKKDIERAKRELPGKIDGLLASGPSKLRVRAQLLIWKLQYKLTDLSLTEAGEEGQFVATINPTFNIGGKVPIYVSDAELIRLVNKVCDATLRKSRILARERTQQRKDGGGNMVNPVLQSKGARSTLAFATRLRLAEEAHQRRVEQSGNPKLPRKRMTPTNPTFVLGKDDQGNDVTVRWHVRKATGPDTNRVINNFRPYIDKNAPGIANSLPKGSSSRQTLNAVQALNQAGQLDAGVAPAVVGDLTSLMYGQEVARNVENVAFSTMALDLMDRERVGTMQAVGMLPFQPKGASSMQGEVLAAAERGDLGRTENSMRDGTAKGDANADLFAEIRRRTVDLVTRWARSELRESLPPTKTKKGFTNWLEKRIRMQVERVIKDGK